MPVRDHSPSPLSGAAARAVRMRGHEASLSAIACALSLLAGPARSQLIAAGGFGNPNTVPGTLAATAERQSVGSLENFNAWKQRLEAISGLTFGFDNKAQYLATDSDRNPSDAATNVFRVYGTWTAVGRGTPDNGALVFKVENRSAIGDHIPTQFLGPSLGYAGFFSSTFSDTGWVLTSLYWRQRFAGGRGSFVIGQVDVYDYVNVNEASSPWNAFTNLEFEQQSTVAGPPQGLGAALLWRLDDNWAGPRRHRECQRGSVRSRGKC